ncbi:D-alanyl-D-alanine carboxypeptidase family protein [Teredinibacter turnerae]|uniref:serine-type D-Ala-D-Ala carboxypeptidase n=1 Tax=Teredinibacter turnerae (strain ATCC 39867 / T7901) TaxID=377629 RepID=C5BNN8_TERTT|nr:D-alanyl-D-alanine carboxypeptidase family protein [Teredinibacter turnerae]ACR12260.1 penicillin-binding protein 6 [Teredinibacter turnerae T7901]
MRFSVARAALVLAHLFILVTPMAANASQVIIPAPPQLAATAYLLIDADTGKVIVEHNADEQLPPASLTKMMTSYIVSEEIYAGRLQETDLVRVSDDAWRRGGAKSGSSTMFLEARSEVPVIDMLRGVIIQSGNDASIALAQHIAGSEEAFAEIMNQQAQLLGMTNSHFRNATGWPAEGHLTTARDLAILAKALINDHPKHYALYSEKHFKHNGISQPNRNKLLFTDNTVDGIKTGHTEAAGYCLVASAKRDGMRLISVVMGAKSENARAAESKKLLAYGFRYYQTHKLYSAGDELGSARVWGGDPKELVLTIDHDILATIPRGGAKNVKAAIETNANIEAPIAKHQPLGKLKISLDDEVIVETDLVAATDIAEAGLVDRAWDAILRLFEE